MEHGVESWDVLGHAGKNRMDLLVSIVTYSPDMRVLADTFVSLGRSIELAVAEGFIENAAVVIVDNGPGDACREMLASALDLIGNNGAIDTAVVSGQGNIGFGAGHNLGGRGRACRYRLVLNPDVILDPGAIAAAITFMEEHPEVGVLSPRAVDEEGRRQFLCKRYPALFDLALRGFAPGFVKKMFDERLARYEMRHECGDEVVAGVPIVSGCFMFIRQDVWLESGGFDPGFFLYFEDFDLSLRIGAFSSLAYVPSVKIAHFGGNTARKGLRHIAMFLKSALRFYRIHGWRILW